MASGGGPTTCLVTLFGEAAPCQQVYLEEADKPAVGEGLNRPAEVTLHKVWRMDKATNRPTTDAEAISRFERKLKKLAADQSARFISYSAETGTWVFEVDHFSRQGRSAHKILVDAGTHRPNFSAKTIVYNPCPMTAMQYHRTHRCVLNHLLRGEHSPT